MRLLWVVLGLVILLLGSLTGYAYFGDMNADPRETRLPVELDLGVEAAPAASVATQAPAAAAPEAPAAEDATADTTSPNAEQNDLD